MQNVLEEGGHAQDVLMGGEDTLILTDYERDDSRGQVTAEHLRSAESELCGVVYLAKTYSPSAPESEPAPTGCGARSAAGGGFVASLRNARVFTEG